MGTLWYMYASVTGAATMYYPIKKTHTDDLTYAGYDTFMAVRKITIDYG